MPGEPTGAIVPRLELPVRATQAVRLRSDFHRLSSCPRFWGIAIKEWLTIIRNASSFNDVGRTAFWGLGTGQVVKTHPRPKKRAKRWHRTGRGCPAGGWLHP